MSKVIRAFGRVPNGVVVLGILAWVAVASAGPLTPDPIDLAALNARLKGRVVDHTFNHGCDRRIWSPALGEKRDMYVYLPPGYDGAKKFPILLWLHGGLQDERGLPEIAEAFDGAIAAGAIPPLIFAIPDGSIRGRPTVLRGGSFYLNSRAGRFEDYMICDIWPFLQRHYAVRPEKEAHILAGASMGGFAAMNLGIKHRDQFHLAAGLMPLVHMRYADCHGNQLGPFDPDCQGIQERYRPLAVTGTIFNVRIRYWMWLGALYRGPGNVARNLWKENPFEMLACYRVQPGELKMFLAYGTCDEFNCDGQVESFLHEARRLGLGDDCTRAVAPGAKHGAKAGKELFKTFAEWLTVELRPVAAGPGR